MPTLPPTTPTPVTPSLLTHKSSEPSGWARATPQRSFRAGAFTLMELLVSMAVIALLAVLLVSVTDNMFRLWRKVQSDVTAFEAARATYDTITRRIAQATLNTYLDYYNNAWERRTPATAATFEPRKYGRASDLHFLSGDAAALLGGTQQGHGVFFFAPLGFSDNDEDFADLPNLLNALGYYVEWGRDTSRPGFLATMPDRYRYRLMEVVQPSQFFTNYPAFTNADPADDKFWIADPADSTAGLVGTNAKKHPLADNIIALIIRPELTEQDAKQLGFVSAGKPTPESLTDDYIYDSRIGENRKTSPQDIQFAQLPPLLRVVMVAVAEKDAARLANGSNQPAALQLDPTWFTDPAKLDDDLKSLEAKLTTNRVQFRTFNQVIPIRGAKFSAKRETQP